METTGDQRHDVPLHVIGGQGVFVKEVQQAVLDGRADLAVHSAKDLPSPRRPAWSSARFTERRDPRDALIGSRLDDLAHGATVATGSVRRRAQLASRRPDLQFVELRGNIDTRLGKVPRRRSDRHGRGRARGARDERRGGAEPAGGGHGRRGHGAPGGPGRGGRRVPRRRRRGPHVLAAIGSRPDASGRRVRAGLPGPSWARAAPCRSARTPWSTPTASCVLHTFLAGPGGVYEGVHEGPRDESVRWAAEAATLARQAVGS